MQLDKIQFNGIYKSFSSPIAFLPPNLTVDDPVLYESVFLRDHTNPKLILGASKQINNKLKVGILATTNESRIFIQSSIAKIEIAHIGNTTLLSAGAIYESSSMLNVEFDLNFYNIIKNTTLNKSELKDNITASITLSTNFD